MTPTQLFQLAGDWRGEDPPAAALISEKIDGWRAGYLPDHTGKRGLWTRGGIPIEGTGHILYWLAEIERAAGEPIVFDGEFQVGDSLAATKAWCEREWKQGGEAGRFHAFDCLTLAEWRAGGSDRPQHARTAMLERLARQVAGDGWDWRPGSRGRDEREAPVVILPHGEAFDAVDVLGAAREVWLGGGEGVMVKDRDAPYRRNRNGAWLKVTDANCSKWMKAAA